MRKAAVLVVDGYEESETVTIVELVKRAGIECHTFGFAEQYVRGMQGMMIKVDKIFSDEIKNYDMAGFTWRKTRGCEFRSKSTGY